MFDDIYYIMTNMRHLGSTIIFGSQSKDKNNMNMYYGLESWMRKNCQQGKRSMYNRMH